ncbi:MAG: RNA-directed DNA polymerase [Deltaproteobacteria bacterium]|nr:RNA-directed DNA polymerase [Deltaproteobacteria bacterium]
MASSTAVSQPLTKQELYQRIRASSLDEVIVDEMVRLGFWPGGQGLPHDPALDSRRRGQLERELRALRTEQGRLYDEEKLIAAMRKKRMEESKESQKVTKVRREEARQAKAEAWSKRKETEILYVGSEHSWGLTVSGDLAKTNEERLNEFHLPVLKNVAELAQFLDVDLSTLRFLTFERRVAKTHHYRRFDVPKKTGGVRSISAPMPKLKSVQRKIVDDMLQDVPLRVSAHGFRRAHSIVSNARPHVAKAIVINMDMKDFFPTVTFPRVRGLFHALGYSMPVSTLLGLLCTELPVQEVQLDGQNYFVKKGERVLPQGAPSSPALTNLLCRRLDSNLERVAAEGGFVYTRYADDLTFSTDNKDADVSGLFNGVAKKVKAEGFWLHPDKTRVMRAGRHQEVTGVVVNDKLGVDRKTLRRFRSFLHRLETKGPDHAHWGNSDDVFSSAMGFARFVVMVDAAKGKAFCERVRTAMKQHGYQPPKTPFKRKALPTTSKDDVTSSAAPNVTPTTVKNDANSSNAKDGSGQDSSGGKKPWWKVF